MKKKKIEAKIVPEYPLTITKWLDAISVQGATAAETAAVLKIPAKKMDHFLDYFPTMDKKIKTGKTPADFEINKALFNRATGFSCPDVRTHFDGGKNGKGWQKFDATKHYPPETTALKFWLTNRQKDQWKERAQVAVSGGKGDNSPIDIKTETKNDLAASILALIPSKPDNPN